MKRSRAYHPSVSASVLAIGFLLSSVSALAQDEAQEIEPAADADDAAPAARGQVYEPAYFAQYAPRNALEMVAQIPGFTITGGNDGQRGLGQASANVLVNGARFSSKSDSIATQLQRIPVGDVVRIEIVDGTTLDIPGLTGQVANVVVASSGTSGQFRWRTGFRTYNTSAQLYGGEVSLTGSTGNLKYTVSLDNDNDRFGADGPIIITDRLGALIETQESSFSGGFDNPKLATNFTWRPSDAVIANLNLSYGEDFFYRDEPENALPIAGPRRLRFARVDENGPEYEIGGDVEFPLGPGTLKLIGLERFERDNRTSTVIDSFDDVTPSIGTRFARTSGEGERIGRFEYRWRMFEADWQVSGEAAFNRLDRISGLFRLDANDEFISIPFPAGTGGVSEDRYESTISFSKQLTDALALQSTVGGEYSKIEKTGVAANARTFQRPKGSASLAWRLADDFDTSIEISREVGQLSFGDFLASVALTDDNQNRGNANLQPDQSWRVDIEVNKGFGAWGSATLELRHAWFEDFVDFFPLPTGGEARGNIGSAQRTHLEFGGLLKMDPIGWRGAQFDFRGVKRWMSVVDPFTGAPRPFSNDTVDLLDIDFRHDIPSSDWAYGASLFTIDNAPYSRLFEIGREVEGPAFVDVFVEHKDIYGLTVNARVANIIGATQQFERTVFAGSRPDAQIAFIESFDRRIGPIFRFSVSGNF